MRSSALLWRAAAQGTILGLAAFAVAADPPAPRDAASDFGGAAPSAAAAADARAATGQMVYFQGRWWYRSAGGAWSYYQGDQWRPFQAPAFSASPTNGEPTRHAAGYRGVEPAAAPTPQPQPSGGAYGQGGGGRWGASRSQEPSGGANGQPNDRFIRGF
jgi:hypothetical protein